MEDRTDCSADNVSIDVMKLYDMIAFIDNDNSKCEKNSGEKQYMNREHVQPVLSIIVPIYNSAPFLKKCIESILSQTYQNMEIILIDDGSTDNSLQICMSFQKKDQRIRVYTKENGGLVSARKYGLSFAKGEVIGFVDSDDWIEPDMYEEMVNQYIQTGCDCVSSGIIREYEADGRSVIVMDNLKEALYENLEDDIYPTMLYDAHIHDFGIYCNLVNKIFRKELLQEVYKTINEDVFYGEDALAFYTYCMMSEKIYIMHKAFYHYNIRQNSMCSTPNEKLPYSNYLLYKGLQSVFMQSKQPEILMKQLRRYALELEYHSLKCLYRIDLSVFDKWEFAYAEDVFEKQFVLYGAGTCGQALFRKMENMQKAANMVAWIDKKADSKTEECLYEIKHPDTLKDISYDCIIIAIKSENTAREIMKELTELYHVNSRKLLWKPVNQISLWDHVI